MEGAMQAFVGRITEDLSDLHDPRVQGRCHHRLVDIVTICVLGSISGADDWKDFEAFGHARQDWLKTFLELPWGIPSHDTFQRVLNKLNREQFSVCLFRWTQDIQKMLEGKLIAIDGKTLRASSSKSQGLGNLHLVTAWASDMHLTLGQVACAEKSNEITAIPELLDLVDVKGATVTIDAMGCQKEIAEKVREKRGHYVLAVKDNQPTLASDLCDLYVSAMDGELDAKTDECESKEKGHGRIEHRTCRVIEIPKGHRQRELWKGLRTLVVVTLMSIRNGKEHCDTRWFISSLGPEAKQLAHAVRKHWSIENSQHYVLDVTFGEDSRRQQHRNGAANLAAVRRLALSIVRRGKQQGVSVKTTRLRCALDPGFLVKLLETVDI